MPGKFAVASVSVVFVISTLAVLVSDSAAAAKPSDTDFRQCSNKNPLPGVCVWINGIIQSSNSLYSEGMSVPQRAVFTGISATTGNVHTMTFNHEATKAGIHAYDWLTGWNQGNLPPLTLNPCGVAIGATALATCTATELLTGTNQRFVDFPNDPYISHDGSTQSRINGFETAYGNRQMRMVGSSAITAASMTLSHKANCGSATLLANGADTGDSNLCYTLTWTSASANLILEFGGHLSLGLNQDDGWGVGKGSSSVSGGPYHLKLEQFDGSALGSQDNQIQGSNAIAPPPQQGTLTVYKVVVNNNGGTKAPSNFTLHVADGSGDVAGSPQPGSALGTPYTLDAGVYNVSEDALSGYVGTFSGDCNASGQVTIESGGNKNCTITNHAQAAHLVVIKHVANGNGGALAASAFNISVTGGNPSPSSFPGAESPGTLVTLDAGSYLVTESGPDGYASSFSADCSGSIAPGQNKTCLITNDDEPASLRVIKHVVNDDGGQADASDFNLSVAGGAPSPSSFGGSESGVLVSLNAGSYNVSESGLSGYAASYSEGCSGIILNGQNKTCTITNDDIQPKLHVIKHVTNDNGGDADASDFNIAVGGTNASPSEFAGDENGTLVLLDAGSYLVLEAVSGAYNASFSAECSGSIAIGQEKTCTITNDDVQPKLHVIKHVVNDDGGDADASDFLLNVSATNPSPSSFPGNESGVLVALDAGAYAVSESGPDGYNASLSLDCTGSIDIGEEKTCTITNDDVQPKLHVIKHVVNDNGGDAGASDFNLSVAGTNASPSSFLGDEDGTLVLLDAGSYLVGESGPGGYNASYSADCAGSIAIGEEKTCTVTNADIQPILYVVKHVVADDGGPEVASDFTMSVTGSSPSPSSFAGNESGTEVHLNAGPYSVGETGPPGYASNFTGDCAGTIHVGETRTCFVLNDDIGPLLLVTKHVINDNGGNASAAAFQISVAGIAVDPASFAGNESGVLVSLNAGNYSVNETGPAGYAGSLSEGCNGSIAVGQVKNCTITNDDIQPRLYVAKCVTNDNGGEASPSDFNLSVAGASPDPSAFLGDCEGILVLLNAGSYLVTESGPNGYAANFSADCGGSIAVGETKFCLVVNDDIQPKLHVIKHVVNDNGGDAVASDFEFEVLGDAADPAAFAGNESGVLVLLNAGGYLVNESGPPGYAANFSAGCSGSIAIGEEKTCAITNDDIQPKLHVIKHVVNDNGGSASASAFNMSVAGTNADPSSFPGNESGTLVLLDAGSYLVGESGPSGYAANASADCAGSIALGEEKTCTITNDDIQPKLHVIKHVTNDNGGTALAPDFLIGVSGDAAEPASFAGNESGVLVLLNAGSYAVNETGPSGYAANFSAECAGSIAIGEEKTCTITNDDIQPKLHVIKHVTNDNGGGADASDFNIAVGGTNASPSEFAGDENGTLVLLDAGSYLVLEAVSGAYNASFSAECSGSIAIGQEKTCTITNDDNQPKLLVIKHVINDNGGSASASAFTMGVAGLNASPSSFAGDENGTLVLLDAGNYSVNEAGPSGYAASYGTDCSGVIAIGETKTCMVTNDDRAPRLIVIKHVINDSGGSSPAGAFTIGVAATSADPASFPGDEAGVTVTLAAGSYVVSEGASLGYSVSYSSDCSGSIALGEEKTCIVTNNDGLITRTQGFWQTHTAFTKWVFDNKMGSKTWVGHNPGPGNKTIGNYGQLFGAYYSDIAKMSNNQKRSPVDKARMVLLQQLLTTKLNCAAFGCGTATLALIAAADNAYAGTNTALMSSLTGQLDAYNNSGDAAAIPPTLPNQGSATPSLSQGLANKVYWNVTLV